MKTNITQDNHQNKLPVPVAIEQNYRQMKLCKTVIKQQKRKRQETEEKKCKEGIQEDQEKQQTEETETTEQEQKENKWTAEHIINNQQKNKNENCISKSSRDS